MSSEEALIQIENLEFSYGKLLPNVIRIPELRIARGESVFLHGPSGSGKTTLLGLLAGVLQSRKGKLRILGSDLGTLDSRGRDRFRGDHLGYIFQMFNLIPYLSVVENIALPCSLSPRRNAKLGAESPHEAARRLSAGLGIESLLDKKVTELSVGQQQRVAAARALIGSPELVIADEPTSALDFDHRERFIELLFKESRRAGSTVLFVSHDRQLMPLFSRAVSLQEINQA